MNCSGSASYKNQLVERRNKEAQTLASLTGWTIREIKKQMGTLDDKLYKTEPSKKWFQKIFK